MASQPTREALEREVTELKRRVRELEQQPHALSHLPRPGKNALFEWLRDVFEGSPAALVGLDTSGNVALWSVGAERLFGWSREEVLGKPSPLVPLEGREEFSQLFALNFEGKSPTVRRLTRLDKSGRRLVVNLATSPICDEPGEVVMVFGVFVDTTEQREAEAALQRSEARYRRLTENAPDLIWRADSSGRIAFANSAVTSLLGYSPRQFLGKEPETYLTPESAAILREWLARIDDDLGLDSRLRAELLYVDCDGTIIPCECRVVIERDDDMKIVGIEGISRDIRHRRKTEAQRAELQQQLFRAQKAEAIGRLAGGVAHNFNNILTAIMGSADWLESEHGANAEIAHEAREIVASASRGAKLITDLLAFSRKQPYAPRVMRPEKLLEGTQTVLQRALGADIRLRFRIEPVQESIRADRGQLEQVLINLALNAKDAMPEGGTATVAISSVESLDPHLRQRHKRTGPFIRLRVQDEGVGMPPEVVARVFEPFFTTKPLRAGSGLGLSMVQGIVEQHGGFVEVSSELGVGSVFDVYLPAVQDPTQSSAPPPAHRPRGGQETVLLVEDERSVRDTVKRQLERLGYIVLVAEDAEGALLHIQKHSGERIDLLLTDVVMPGMRGTELWEKARVLRPSMRVLFTSGYPDGETKLKRSGGQLLPKPFSMVELATAVRGVLDPED